MMKLKPFFVLLSLLNLVLQAIFAQVKADFTVDNTSGCSPLVVSFTNNSTGENLTYSWDKPDVQRFCMYVPAFSEDDVPDFHPFLRRHAAGVPVQADRRSFIIGYTLRRDKPDYIKIENDYDGNIMDVLQTCIMVPPASEDTI